MSHLNTIILNDVSSNRILPGLLLRPLGHQVHEFEDFSKVLDLLKIDASPYTHLLSDISMPMMSGTDFCASLKKNSSYDHIRMISYTTHAMSHERMLILAAGFDDMPIKPMTSHDLKRALGLVEIRA